MRSPKHCHRNTPITRSSCAFRSFGAPALAILSLLLLFILLFSACRDNSDNNFAIAIYLTADSAQSVSENAIVDAARQLAGEQENDRPTVTSALIQAEGGPTRWEAELAEMARQQRYNLIVGRGAELGHAVYRLAPRWPNQSFLLLDVPPALLPTRIPNVRAIYFNYHEIGFLAGAMAALLQRSLNTEPPPQSVEQAAQIAFIVIDNSHLSELTTSLLFGSQTILPLTAVKHYSLPPQHSEAQARQIVRRIAEEEIALIVSVGHDITAIASEASRHKIHHIALAAPRIRRRSIYATIGVEWERVAYEEMRRLASSGSILGRVAQVGSREGYLAVAYPRWHYLRPIPKESYLATQQIIDRLRAGNLNLPPTVP